MFLLTLLTLLSVFVTYHLYWKRRNLPPGPIPLPLLGHMHLMAKFEPGYELWKWLGKNYGPVATIWMSEMPMVSISDYKLIKETIIKDGTSYVGRPVFPFNEVVRGAYGLLESYGNLWQQQRRFVLHVLRNFGMGQNLMEEKVVEQSRIFTEMLRKEALKGPVDLQDHFDAAVGSIINTVLMGYGYDETNMEEFRKLKKLLADQIERVAYPSTAIITMYPSLKVLPVLSETYKSVQENFESLFDLFEKEKEKREKTIDYDSDSYSDYMEAFLKERKKHEHEEDFGGFSLLQLYNSCLDLWMAGMETTSNTLYWSVLYTLTNPHVHKKIVEELDQVINSTRFIDMRDKPNLNYINATIFEVQRLANLLPMNVARTNDRPVVIGGHAIPANTAIIPQISSILYNDEIFPDPYKFDPTRFLDENGGLKKIEEFIPFSIGKRQCLGEGLAKLELFIFFANFFNQFKVSIDPANPNPSTKKKFSFTMKAINFTVCLEQRG